MQNGYIASVHLCTHTHYYTHRERIYTQRACVTQFGKMDLFDKNIILTNKQLKMPYIYKTIEK